MTTITVQLEETKAQALREKADRYGLNPEQFLTASLEDLIGQPDNDFDEAARRVLSKNKELYRRLS
ncbi:MAG: DNA-binding protein [Candidatus Auribacterota bacterium]|nr:DNA-binding protein [Candidatus Auribacterota bacterium]